MNNRNGRQITIARVFCIIIVVQVPPGFLTTLSVSGTAAGFTEETCATLLRNIHRPNATVHLPLFINGLWTSLRCEVRPGPQFVLRKYSFFEGGLFELHQYFYADSHCHTPSYSLSARGQYMPYQQSWIVDGAAEVDYQLWHATVMPYTQESATLFSQKVKETNCSRKASSWQPFERYVIYQYLETDMTSVANISNGELKESDADFVDCLESLDVSFHELQLMRVEQRRLRRRLGDDNITGATRRDSVTKMLLLGDIHTEAEHRNTYRPTGYQDPLVTAETLGCQTCRTLVKSTDYFPPQLPTRPRLVVVRPPHLRGFWMSDHCETRSYGTFLTRSLLFHDNDDQTQETTEFFYSDALCRNPSYSVQTRGNYTLVGQAFGDTVFIQFKISEIKITCRSMQAVRQLTKLCPISSSGIDKTSSSRRGRVNKAWRLDVPQDVTSSRGCSDASINIPEIESDILRIETRPQRSLLYLGQRPSDEPVRQHTDTVAEIQGSNETTIRDTKMTSFQPALVRCIDERKQNSFSEHHRRVIAGNHVKDLKRVRVQYADYQRQRVGVVNGVSQTSKLSMLCIMFSALNTVAPISMNTN